MTNRYKKIILFLIVALFAALPIIHVYAMTAVDAGFEIVNLNDYEIRVSITPLEGAPVFSEQFEDNIASVPPGGIGFVTQFDEPGFYKYEVRQVIDEDRPGIIWDRRIYIVTFGVWVNEDTDELYTTLTVTLKCGVKPCQIEFKNGEEEVTPPPTCPPTCPPTEPPTEPPTCPPVTEPPTCPPTEPPTCPPTCPPVTEPPTCPPVTPEVPTTPAPEPEVPMTGDSTTVWVGVGVIAAGLLTAGVLYARRKVGENK